MHHKLWSLALWCHSDHGHSNMLTLDCKSFEGQPQGKAVTKLCGGIGARCLPASPCHGAVHGIFGDMAFAYNQTSAVTGLPTEKALRIHPHSVRLGCAGA